VEGSLASGRPAGEFSHDWQRAFMEWKTERIWLIAGGSIPALIVGILLPEGSIHDSTRRRSGSSESMSAIPIDELWSKAYQYIWDSSVVLIR